MQEEVTKGHRDETKNETTQPRRDELRVPSIGPKLTRADHTEIRGKQEATSAAGIKYELGF